MNRFSAPEQKVALFRSLFCGKEDVYAQRFVSRRDGRAGSSPACANEWVRDLCRKPRIRCADCLHQSWKPVTEEVIRWHLEGKDAAGAPFVMGSCAMMADETCKFSAVDFDGWARWECSGGFAFPSITRYLGKDGGLDKARAQPAEKQVAAWRSENR